MRIVVSIMCIVIYTLSVHVDELHQQLEQSNMQVSVERHQTYTVTSELESVNSELEDYKQLYGDVLERIEGEWKYTAGIATAYAPYDNKSGICNDGDPLHTSTGVAPGPEIIAVDPNRIPYGSTIMVILPNGACITGIAGDTGSALRKDERMHIDIFHYTYEDAMEFGVKEVFILWKE